MSESGDAVAELVNQARLATLGMLVAGLAHEINTPLGALNSNHDLLRRALGRLQVILADEVVDPDELEEVRRIVRAFDGILQVNDMAVERMMSLVMSLRTFGRLDSAEIDRTDLHEGIDSTLAIIAHELKDVTVVLERGALPLIECLPHQINQVFMNLLLNARQAMPDGGTISIRTRTEGDVVAVSIADTGTGMDSQTIARIFEPGFTTKGARIGMGLGLIICRRIVDSHGGTLDVQSAPGVGSTFTVRLPCGQNTALLQHVNTSSAEDDHATS